MTGGNTDQSARDAANEAKSMITAHERECEMLRRSMEDFMRRTEAVVAEIKGMVAASSQQAQSAARVVAKETADQLDLHRRDDTEAFNLLFNRLWWMGGAGYGILIPLCGFLAGKALHLF